MLSHFVSRRTGARLREQDKRDERLSRRNLLIAGIVVAAAPLTGCLQTAINAADNKPLSSYEDKVAAWRFPRQSRSGRQAAWNALDEEEQDDVQSRFEGAQRLQRMAENARQRRQQAAALTPQGESGGGDGGGSGGGGGD